MKTNVLLLALVLLLPVFAQAEVSYNYLEAGLNQTNFDFEFGDDDGMGYNLEAAFEINDDFFFAGTYTSADIGFFDFTTLFIGAGYHSDISQPIQFVGMLGFARAEVDVGSFGDADESGYQVSVGARGELNPAVEWDLFLDYIDLDDSDTSLRGEARYKFSPTLAGGVNFSTGDDISIFGVHIRWLY